MAIEESTQPSEKPLEEVFSNDKFFSSLLSCTERFPGNAIAVNDPTNGVSATYNQLIGDIVTTRKAIYDAWPREIFDNQGILKGSPWIGLLVPTSYEFVVGCLVILSVGGAIMPMRKLSHGCVKVLSNTYRRSSKGNSIG
jgi:malonyl-CoA/methylmalonyl-CoA synthetase